MRKIVVVLVIGVLGMGSVFAEPASPQLAFLFLDEYVQKKEDTSGRKIGGAVTLGIGSAAFAGGAVLFFFGDPISQALSPTNEAWDPETKYIVSGSLAATGLVGMGVGTALLLAPPPDYRARFAEVYSADDPALRESLAAAALFDIAEEARRARILSGVTNISIPVLSVGLQIGINLAVEEDWHKGLTSVSFWQIGTVVNGLMSLFDKSEEEKLYLRYQAAKSALTTGGG